MPTIYREGNRVQPGLTPSGQGQSIGWKSKRLEKKKKLWLRFGSDEAHSLKTRCQPIKVFHLILFWGLFFKDVENFVSSSQQLHRFFHHLKLITQLNMFKYNVIIIYNLNHQNSTLSKK